MNTGTKIALFGLAGATFAAWRYRRGIDALKFALHDIQIMPDGTIKATIAVLNPSRFFSYPVPRVDLGIFDSQDNYLGTLSNTTLQWIGKGRVSAIVGYIKPNYVQLINLLTTALTSAAPIELILHGSIYLANTLVPVNTELQISTDGI